MIWRIRHFPRDGGVPCILEGIAGPAAKSAGPKAFEGEFHSFSFRVKVGEIPAVKNDQVIHLVPKTGEGRPEMGADLLLVHQLVTSDFLGGNILEPEIA